MVENEIPEDLAKTVEFHGHLCPGLVTGYLAAKVGLERLEADRAEDEELIAIVENDSCAVDAVQVLTSCTTGKGNLFLRDYGKMVFTFAVRPSGRAVRVSLKHRTASEGEQAPEASQKHGDTKIQYLLRQPLGELFSIREETIALPETARIHQSVVCQRCGEMVMETRTRSVSGSSLCIPCAEAAGKNAAAKGPTGREH
jgi:formylmethanofuran dehydrogenase subunit E